MSYDITLVGVRYVLHKFGKKAAFQEDYRHSEFYNLYYQKVLLVFSCIQRKTIKGPRCSNWVPQLNYLYPNLIMTMVMFL